MSRSLLAPAGALTMVVATSAAAAQTLAVQIPDVDDPRLKGLAIPATAATQGMWSPQFPWPLVGIHLSVLPDGQIFSYGTPLGRGVQDGRTLDRWNPLSPDIAAGHTTIANSQNVDSFCGAGVLQSGGGMLLSSGDSFSSPGNQSRNSTVFNLFNNTATTQASTLAADRWYATMLVLPDARTLIVGGADAYNINMYDNPDANLAKVAMTPEVWTPGVGWRSLPGANSRTAFGPDFNRWWYPHAWVAPNGRVFGISAEKWWYLDPAGTGSIPQVGNFKTAYDNTLRPNIGPTSTAVMYDVGRILQAGGNGANNERNTPSSALATTLDITGDTPRIAETSAMMFPRQWANSTVLPNGRVLVTGGSRFGDRGGQDAVFAAEWWNPDTGMWSTLSSAAVIRNYHSTTVLLPNGTVLSAGGGVPGPVTNLNAEIFYPPYLFTTDRSGRTVLADRPRLTRASSSQFRHDDRFAIEVADARTIARVVMIGLSSTTHSFNMGQRYIPLQFTQAGRILTITAPATASIAPPGYYYLVAVDAAGVPSRGFVMSTALPSFVDPVATYAMNEGAGGTIGDASGNGRAGALKNAAWGTGRKGSAVRFSAGSHVELPNGLVQACTDFTFAAWVNLASNPNWNRIFDFGSSQASNMFLTTRAGGATVRFAITQSGNAGEQRISFPQDFPLNKWQHVAVVLRENTGVLYLNGTPVAQNANLTLDPLNLGNTVNNWLGRSQYAADPGMDGSLEAVQISCRAYSAAEIAALAAR